MAFIAGLVTKEEKAELIKRGWDIEPAEKYNLVGSGESHLMSKPLTNGYEPIVIWVDGDVLEVMKAAYGPGWEHAHGSE